jgi:hypothetical protein
VCAVPRERERPTPSLVPTSSALMGSGAEAAALLLLLLLEEEPSVVVVAEADAPSLEVAVMAGRRPDEALRRSTR